MATNKSSTTKSKTNTTKKTAKAATSAKTSTSDKKEAPKAPAGKVVNILKLRSLHMMSAGVFILLALAAWMFMGNQSHQLTIGYLTNDIVAADQNVLAPAVRAVYDIEVRWALIIILVLSAILPVLYLTKLEKAYAKQLENTRTVPWRWVDFAVTGALLTETVAFLSGVQDLMVLKLIAGIVAISFVLAWIVEWHYKSTHNAWKTYAVAVAGAVLPWILIAVSAISTVIYGGVWAPWYVYALYAVLIAGFFSIFCIQFNDYKGKREAWQKNYLVVERNYQAVNILTKAAFAIILIVGLLK